MQVNMSEAKSQLSRLGELVCQGERVIIAKAGKPYLELRPYEETKREPRPLGILAKQGWPEPRPLGGYEGQIWIGPDFEWTDEEIEEFYKDDPEDPLFQ